MAEAYTVLHECENQYGRKFRLIRTLRERESMADLYLEERKTDREGVEYWSVIEHDAVWSRKEKDEFNQRHNKHGEVSIEMILDDFIYNWQPTP